MTTHDMLHYRPRKVDGIFFFIVKTLPISFLTFKLGVSYSNIQRWLSPADARDHLHHHESECMNGSCAWALDTQAVRAFFRSKENEILRIGGDPGSGKSTLAALLIHHIKEFTGNDAVYFFCNGTDAERQKPVQVLRTLISQILSKDESLYSSFEQLYLHSGREVIASFAELQDYYQLCLKNTQRKTLHVVVDALDECQQGPELISFLIQSLAATKGVVKLILTCRNEPELLDAFPKRHYELITSPTQTATPIKMYVRKRVSENKYISGTILGSQVINKVASAAGGSWLYARLMMDEIQRLPSAVSVRRQLDNIPSGLKQVYLQIFATMERSMSPPELRLAQQIFLWIDLSDFVLVGRIVLDRQILDLVLQAEMSGEKVFDSLALAQQLCSPLVTLFQSGRHSISVNFFHHTAAQFLRECSQQRVSDLPMILKPQTLKGLYRGSVSVWYFTNSPNSTRILEQLRIRSHAGQGEYFEMAYGLWAAFFFENLPDIHGQNELAEIERLVNQLTNFILSEAVFVWIEMAIIINYSGGFDLLFVNALRAIKAAELGVNSSLSIFREFSALRKQFFEDYAYVISITGPRTHPVDKPDGFEMRPLAAQLLSLGRKWKHLYKEI
jgi:energy-coupling factor transporter ATP-binding protein EcfA2